VHWFKSHPLLAASLWPRARLKVGGLAWGGALLICTLAGALTGVLPFLAFRPGYVSTQMLPVQAIHRDGLSCYVTASDGGVWEAMQTAGEARQLEPFDSPTNPQRSPHRVLIRRLPLSQPHALYAAIIEGGAGRFSFWSGSTIERGGVYFSLPASISGDLGPSDVAIEWVFSEKRTSTHILWVGTAWVVVALGLIWGGLALGSIPAALALGLAGIPWGAWLGMAIPAAFAGNRETLQGLGMRQVDRMPHYSLPKT